MDAAAERDLAAPGLQRTLKFHHLILYGIIIIQPTAPMSIYGVVSNAARGHVVLYGMGRADALPKKVFGVVSPKTRIPRNNVLLLGAVTLLGTFLLTFEQGAELLNFGAFIAFIGVNAAALVHYKFRSQEKVAFALLSPLCGILVCTFIWLNLNLNAKLLGAAWIAVGLLLYFTMRKTTGRAAAELQG